MSDAERNVNINYNFTESGADNVTSSIDDIESALSAQVEARKAALQQDQDRLSAIQTLIDNYNQEKTSIAAATQAYQDYAVQQNRTQAALQDALSSATQQITALDQEKTSLDAATTAFKAYNDQQERLAEASRNATQQIPSIFNAPPGSLPESGYLDQVEQDRQQALLNEAANNIDRNPLSAFGTDQSALRAQLGFDTGTYDRLRARLFGDQGGVGAGFGSGDAGGGADDGGGDLGGIGSLFSLARSARGASQLANLVGGPGAGAGLTGGADALYAVQGIRTLSDILPKLSQSFQDLPGLLGDMAAGGAAVAGSFGAVLSVAVPAALAITAAVEIIKLLSDETDKLAQADKAQYDEEQKLIDQKEQAQQQAKTETIPQAQGQLDTTLTNRQDQINVLAEQEGKLSTAGDAYKASLTKLTGDVTNPFALFGDLLDSISKGKDVDQVGKNVDDALTKVSDLNGTYDSQTKTLIPLVNINQQLLEQQQGQAAAVENQLSQNEKYSADNKLTSDAASAKILQLQQEGANQQQAADSLDKLNSGLDTNSQQYADNAAAIKNHREAAQNDADEIKYITYTALPEIILRREDEANAITAQTDALKQHTSFIEQTTKLAQSGTDQGVASERDTLVGKLTDAQNTVTQLTQTVGPLTDAQKTQLANAQQLVPELQNEIAELDRYTANTVKAREALEGVAKAQDTYTKAVASAQAQLAGQLLDAEYKEAQAEKELTQGSLQDTQERSQIALKESRDEVKIKQDTADAITDINTKLAVDQQKDATDLYDQRQDAEQKHQYDLQKDQLDYNRTSEQDAVDHNAKIAQIQQNAYQDEFSALLTRNFSKVAQDQAKEKQDEQKENTAYGAQESKLQTHLRQQEQDQSIALQHEETQQTTDYERKLAAQQASANAEITQQNTNEQRKITAAQAAQKQALQDLTDSEAYKIKVLRYNLGVEEALYEAQEQRRIKVAAETEIAIIANSYKILGQAIGQLFGFGTSNQTVNVGGVTVQSSAPSLSGTGFDAGQAVANLVKGIFR